MKFNRTFLPLILLLLASFVHAQEARKIWLRSGVAEAMALSKQPALDSFSTRLNRVNNKSFLILQFSRIPDVAARSWLSSHGIDLLEYIPDAAYTVCVRGSLDASVLKAAGVSGILPLTPGQKMEPRLSSGILPSSAIKVRGTVDVWISFPRSFSLAEVQEGLKAFGADLQPSPYSVYRILALRVAQARSSDLAGLPFVEYVQPAPPGDQSLNYNSRYASGANLLNASVADGGKGLNGEGVVVGVGDNADVQTHIDFSGRLINRSPEPVTMGHGHHVTGTVGGAGNGNEMYRGYAPKATIVSQGFNGIILNAPAYVNDYGMVVTNNSYGDNIECGYYGSYDLYSRLLDQMAFDLPHLENVFSAGNSGLNSCAPFLPNYHTVLGGYQSAKNVISVGATNDSGAISGFSSRGPVKDGRTKPEVVAMGQFVASAWADNYYGYNNGTSMAGPAVVGGLALLYQRYRQLNGGADPKNALMKALVCNGAIDRGNTGPDFQYGFGWLNLLRSVDMMENNRYFISNVAQGGMNTHTVSVPAGTAQLKVLLYWNDPAASPLTTHTLVNDLDLEIVDPSTGVRLPFVLDTSNAGLPTPAGNGADHINNLEQVVISNPAPGNYTIRVKGTAIAQNPSQEYVVVYDPVPVQLKITAPAGGEALSPSTGPLDMMKINWTSFGYSAGTVTIELSLDNGSSWTTVASNVNIKRDIFTWYVPDVATSTARVRITKDGSGETTMSAPFTIIGRPVAVLDPVQCEGYIKMNWNAIAGADSYDVMMLIGDEMKTVANTTSLSYTFSGLSRDSTYSVTVRPMINGRWGRRAVALTYQPNTGTCSGSISDNDLKLEAIEAPVTGRSFTSSDLGGSETVRVRIKNLDDAPVSNFDLLYSINGGPFVTEHVSATVNAGATYTYSFTTTADLSATGTYSFVAVVKNSTSDAVTANDTLVRTVRHLANAPLNLSAYFVDDMEGASPAEYLRDTTGLTGLDRYDLSRTTVYGRLRTFVNTGMAHSGNRALTLDANRFYAAGNTNFLTGTFNLAGYPAVAHDLRVDFFYNNHGQEAHPNNQVWIRGNDAQPWIPAYDLDNNQDDPGHFKKTTSIPLSDLLLAAGQSFGTSFQIRWGQFGRIAATDPDHAAGYTFDDLRLYEVFNDLQALSVDGPLAASCGLTAATDIRFTLYNSANLPINNVPVRYRIDNGSWVSEVLPSIAAKTSLSYTFVTKADLSALGTHTVEVITDLPGDSFHENDTARITINHVPVIGSFPYLQNFEGDNGYWYTGGRHSSWEYGTPSSNRISGAASGTRAWKTRLAGNYNDDELSYLYSPCFDLTGLTNPTLSFSLALDLEDCGSSLCDGAWVEYSADGLTWQKLGASGSGTNWYNKAADQLWSIQNFTRWHVATIPLPAGLNRLRLRFVMNSDPAANREGIAVDDIHVYDNTQGIYSGPTLASPVSQVVGGNSWVDFSSGGKLIASLHPNGQNLGAVDVQAYINTGAVRYTAYQYYHDRNLTIRPSNPATDSVSVRFYFLDTETDSLTKATGCPGCSRPASAYELGISKYSDADATKENGTIADDQSGSWTFIIPDKVTKVPFDKGYYAEFKVRSFSEFWLNNGGFNHLIALPVKLLDFTAARSGNVVNLNWKVAAETGVSRYEVEVARGNEALQAGSFAMIGSVASAGNTAGQRNYTYADTEADKFGARYYRLKIVNNDGSFSYSSIQVVLFDDALLWQVYPNPSDGRFQLVYQLGGGQVLRARVYNGAGGLVKEYSSRASGYVQKLTVDLTAYPAGVYLLQTEGGDGKKWFKLYRK